MNPFFLNPLFCSALRYSKKKRLPLQEASILRKMIRMDLSDQLVFIADFCNQPATVSPQAYYSIR